MIHVPTNILLVDDEKDFVEMLSMRLEDAGDKVTPAYDGQYVSRDSRKKNPLMWSFSISRCPAWTASKP
jgi:CheY-like chemotaxis protein